MENIDGLFQLKRRAPKKRATKGAALTLRCNAREVEIIEARMEKLGIGHNYSEYLRHCVKLDLGGAQ